MLKEASKKYKINLKNSFVIGDRWKDINAGKKQIVKQYLLIKGYSEKLRKKPDYVIKNFYGINKIIKS